MYHLQSVEEIRYVMKAVALPAMRARPLKDCSLRSLQVKLIKAGAS
jgi:hypothetical protein